jgi:hypothetical protein
MELRMMNGATFDGTGFSITGIHMVPVDESPAGAGGVPEQFMDAAGFARQCAPGGLVVDGFLHWASFGL